MVIVGIDSDLTLTREAGCKVGVRDLSTDSARRGAGTGGARPKGEVQARISIQSLDAACLPTTAPQPRGYSLVTMMFATSCAVSIDLCTVDPQEHG